VGWFKREYEVSCGLRAKVGSGVADVYELAYLRDRWVMVFEDFGGRSLSMLDLAGQLDLADFLSLAIDIADILGRLHRHQIVHKDLNPSNIVLNPETGQVKIIDFGISTVLSRETLSFRNPNVLEGTLSYISPEQTGRMNRAVDYRTDFYSLGVTFYELVTGRLPFIGDDSVELVHSHIAKQPPALFNFRPDLPPVISDIILKLMAKNAEDRYQSAHGLKQDLSECLRHLIDLQQLTNFRLELGQQDWSNRLQVPQKLYGREAEISQLLAGFERVTRAVDHSDKVSTPQNRVELMLIAGQAGIGKSALVQEVYQPLTEQRGYFISGKFDQLQRIIPYSALTQAFRGLIRQLLTESESAVAAWREKLLTALKSNGQVIIDVIPEVELIIGPQPPVPELGSAEAQNRFQLTFQNFTRIFAQPEHPLILFIDDLQWADSGSLKLLEILLTAFEIGPLYVIGAYRDNEIDQAHALHRLRKQTTEAGVPVTQIALGPLAQTDVSRLISDTVYAPVSRVQPLAQLVFEKTGGNPFFTLEFIKALYEDELLTLTDPQSEKQAAEIGWHWDLAQIQARAMTDNVVELLVGKIRRLSPEAQQVLPLAACIGNQFDLQTLAIVAKKSLPAAAANLSQALQEGLILPLDDAYRYVSIVDRPEQIEAR
jgi:serine/threonine protein kinase